MTDFAEIATILKDDEEWRQDIRIDAEDLLEAIDLACRYQANMETISRLTAERDGLRKALRGMQAFVGVMFGRGRDAKIPETVDTPLGVPVRTGDLMREVESALATPRDPDAES